MLDILRNDWPQLLKNVDVLKVKGETFLIQGTKEPSKCNTLLWILDYKKKMKEKLL